MKQLKAGIETTVKEEIREVSDYLHALFLPGCDKERHEEIRQMMSKMSVSDWFSCFIRSIFRHLYTENPDEYTAFVRAVSPHYLGACMDDFHALRAQVVAQHGGVLEKLNKLRQEQKSMQGKSFSNLAKAIARNKELCEQIAPLEANMQPSLVLFLIVEKIIFVLSQGGLIDPNEEAVLACRENMLRNPASYIIAFVPILTFLQAGVTEDDGLGEMVAQTIQLVGIDDDEDTVEFVVLELCAKNFLSLVDLPVSAATQQTAVQSVATLPKLLSRPVLPPIFRPSSSGTVGAKGYSVGTVLSEHTIEVEEDEVAATSSRLAYAVLPPIKEKQQSPPPPSARREYVGPRFQWGKKAAIETITEEEELQNGKQS